MELSSLIGEELVSKVSKVGFMKTNPACASILTEAKDYHIVPASQPYMQNNRTKACVMYREQK